MKTFLFVSSKKFSQKMGSTFIFLKTDLNISSTEAGQTKLEHFKNKTQMTEGWNDLSVEVKQEVSGLIRLSITEVEKNNFQERLEQASTQAKKFIDKVDTTRPDQQLWRHTLIQMAENGLTKKPFASEWKSLFAKHPELRNHTEGLKGWQNEDPELLKESPELFKAVYALSTFEGKKITVDQNGNKHDKHGNPIETYSYNFLHHPEFEKHYLVLKAYWGKLSKDHPQRKSFEIIKEIKRHFHQIKAKGRKRPLEWYEIYRDLTWRRAYGQDVFMMGYTHDEEGLYQKKHTQHLKQITQLAGVIGIEGSCNIPIGDSLDLKWQNNNQQKIYEALMRLVPNKTFVDIDPRDQSKVNIDSFDCDSIVEIPASFFPNFFTWLKTYNPQFLTDQKLNQFQDLEALWKKNTLSKKGKFSYVDDNIVSSDGTEINNNILYRSPLNITSLAQSGGIDESWMDDMASSLKLRKLTNLMAVGKTKAPNGRVVEGPIVDFEGANHIFGKRWAFDHPLQASMEIMRMAYFVHQANILKDEADNVKENADINLQRIKKLEQVFALPPKKAFTFLTELMAIHFGQTEGGRYSRNFPWIGQNKSVKGGNMKTWGIDFNGNPLEDS